MHFNDAVFPPSKLKGSCRTYTDPCQTSDKGKGRGSLAVANGPTRSQSSTKKSSGGPAQPQKKHKVSVLYGKYKVSAASTNFNTAAAPPSPTPSPRPISPSPPVDEERPEEQVSDQIMDTRNNNNNSILISHDVLDERPGPVQKVPPFKEPREKEPVMFPMETHVIFPENPCPAPAFKASPPTDVAPEKEAAVKRSMEKRDNTESEVRHITLYCVDRLAEYMWPIAYTSN